MSLNEKQGHAIGQLTSRSNDELKELLHKQTEFLKNKNIINRLPDKGRKIELLIVRISDELNSRQTPVPVCSGLESFSRMTLHDVDASDDVTTMLGKILIRDKANKVYINSYEQAIDRAHVEAGDGKSQRPKFYANSTLIQHVSTHKQIDASKDTPETKQQVPNKVATGPTLDDVISPICKLKETITESGEGSLEVRPLSDGRTEASTASVDSSSTGEKSDSVSSSSAATVSSSSTSNVSSSLTATVSSSSAANLSSSSGATVSSSSTATMSSSSTAPGKSAEGGVPYRSFSSILPRVKFGYDESLVDLKPARLRARMIDFEESFALLNEQVLHSKFIHNEQQSKTFNNYRASQQEFHEEVEDVDDDADDGAELDYA